MTKRRDVKWNMGRKSRPEGNVMVTQVYRNRVVTHFLEKTVVS